MPNDVNRWMDMIDCYATGIFPRPKELIGVTREYERGRAAETELDRAFSDATLEVVETQSSVGFSYVTDGMLRWQDPVRLVAENLNGIKIGGLARWFNNNTFYRKPVVTGELSWKRGAGKIADTEHLPRNLPWKAILPAPYTLAQLSEDNFYKDKTELSLKYARVLRVQIQSLVKQGFNYIQLSDPALVYRPRAAQIPQNEVSIANEALKLAVGGVSARTCLQAFFGDFCQILPEALDFPVDDLGIDLHETDIDRLKGYKFGKGVALGLVDSRVSLVENDGELVASAKKIIKSIEDAGESTFFVCPNCDLEFLPWERALEKMKVVSRVTKRLREELDG
jgi:5-methyltetrahydropteroyltriglutamate--homocysteine methyltransferase